MGNNISSGTEYALNQMGYNPDNVGKFDDYTTDLINQVYTNKFNAQQAEINRSFQHAEAALARDYNTEMWNATNEYNSPTETRKRLVEAGYNPLFLEGSLPSANAPSASGIPSGSLAQGSPSNGGFANAAAARRNSIMNAIGEVAEAPGKLTESLMKASLLNTDMNLKDAQAYLALSNSKVTNADLPWIPIRNKTQVENTLANTNYTNALAGQANAMKSQIELDCQWKKVRNQYAPATLATEYEKLQNELEKSFYEVINEQKQGEVLDAVTGETQSRTAVNNANVKLIGEQAKNIKVDTELAALQLSFRKLGISDNDPFLLKSLALVESGQLSPQKALEFAQKIPKALEGFHNGLAEDPTDAQLVGDYYRVYFGENSVDNVYQGREIQANRVMKIIDTSANAAESVSKLINSFR